MMATLLLHWQLGKFPDTADIEFTDNGETDPFFDIGGFSPLGVFSAVVLQVRNHRFKFLARIDYSLIIGPVEFKEKLKSRQPVEPLTGFHHLVEFLVWQILIEHDEVVAEIEERRPVISLI